jgi:hypothetical protein
MGIFDWIAGVAIQRGKAAEDRGFCASAAMLESNSCVCPIGTALKLLKR